MAFPTTELELREHIQAQLRPLTLRVRELQGLVPMFGEGSPEAVVEAELGELYRDVLNGKLYVKETEPTPDTGWILK